MKREGGGMRHRWARRILGVLFEPDEVEEILRDLGELTRDEHGRRRALAFWTMLCAYPLHEGRERVRAWVDDRREGRTMGGMIEDVGFAWRGLRRRPAFALMALLILSVGFGSVVAVHSVVKGVLLSHRVWRQMYGEDPGLVGSHVVLDGTRSRVIGVLPPRVYRSSAPLRAVNGVEPSLVVI